MSADRHSMLIVRNPQARRARSERALWEASAPLRERGWAVELASTSAAGEATQLAADAAASGFEVVAACGGDGTVHEVVNGLALSDSALAVIPSGTADVWAKEAHVPRDAVEALSLAVRGRRVRVDLGMVEGAFGARYFLLMCGVGLDAEVVQRVGAGSGKRRLGRAWYVMRGAGVLTRIAPTDALVTVDDASMQRPLLQAVAGNTRLYGGVTRLTSAARMDDGLLDLCVFAGSGKLNAVRLVARALRGGLDRRAGKGVEYVRGECIEVRPSRPLAVQADGEYIGETPVRISVRPQALTVLLAPRPNVLLGEQ